jgi:rhamnosyltransferase
MSGQARVWAGIVVYNPNMPVLSSLILALEAQVERIVVFNNGGCTSAELDSLFSSAGHEVIGLGENVGIGLGLNHIARAALADGADLLLTFDQDSSPPAGFVENLLKCIGSLHQANVPVAAVGPVFVDERGESEVFPVFQASRWWVNKTNPLDSRVSALNASILITSGMLVDLKVWEQVGEFRGDFFIDHVDTEWCLRAAAKGFSVHVCTNTVMPHQLSDAPPKRVLGRLVLKYSPLRRYYAFRNTCRLLLMAHVPQGLKNYLTVTLAYRFFLNLIVDEERLASLRAMIIGMVHGFSGRMGRR